MWVETFLWCGKEILFLLSHFEEYDKDIVGKCRL